MYVHTRDIRKIDSKLYNVFYKLNFRANGQMQEVLKDFYHNKHEHGTARVFWIENGGKIVSWALVFAFSTNRKKHAYFYTHRSYRRRGYASKLMKTIEKWYNTVHVHPHDTVSSGFFSTIKTRKVRKVKYY